MIETIPEASALAGRIRDRIRCEGPITFCDWMRIALYDAEEGYYCRENRTKWGRRGDYRTSPERSSLFAATFARYFARLYEGLNKPAQWTIAEVGAGDGHFASVLLQTLQSSFPEMFSATRYVIDEISSSSRSAARGRLKPFADLVAFRKLGDSVVDPGIIFSNELLDAFPVHRVTMHDGTLSEFYVEVGADEQFEWTLGPPSVQRLIDYFGELESRLAEGQVAEINLELEAWLKKASANLHTGYLVTVDYGAETADLYSSAASHCRYDRHQGTLRSFHKHQLVEDVLARPGEQDITSTVDWSLVKSAGARLGLEVVEFDSQDKFLLSAGLLDQLEAELHRSKSETEKLLLSTAAREMILPDGMASHFQVLVQKKAQGSFPGGANGG